MATASTQKTESRPAEIGLSLQDKLIEAAAVGDAFACYSLIREGADCRFPGSSGETAAEVAARGGHTGCLEEFFRVGLVDAWRYAGLDDEDDSERTKPVYDGGEALRAAAIAGQTGAAEMILFAGVDVDSADAQGRTALHLAALYDNPRIVSALIDADANIEQLDIEKRTPLHLARLAHSISSARLLLNAGANPRAKDSKKATPAALAGQQERTDEALRTRFLFYIGAKSELLDAIIETIPWNAKRLIEPFAGSGAVTAGLAFRFTHIDASDANPDIVAALKLAAEEPETLVTELHAIFGPQLPKNTSITKAFEDAERDYYKACLKEFNDRSRPITPARRVALFVYLNRMGWKGLQRITKIEKRFSVPFWKDRIGQSTPDSSIREFHERLHGKATFRVRDFKDAFVGVGDEDFIYLDPPYLPSAGKKETHTGYAGTEFEDSHHTDLAAQARRAADAGATVVVSNHDSPRIRELYSSANEIRTLKVQRGMAHGAEKHEEVDEILAVWKPPMAWIVDALDRPIDPVAALDPFGETVPIETRERLAWRAAERNGWLNPNADPKNISFQSFKKSGAQLLTIARHGTPAARRLVFGRPGREQLLGLEFLAEVVMAMNKEILSPSTVDDFFTNLRFVAEGVESFVSDATLRDDILRRCLKTKLKTLLNPDGDAKRTLLRDRLAKRYGFAAAVMGAHRWRASSEPGGRLLLLAERCTPRSTDAFGRVCSGILEHCITETAFLAMFPAVKIGPARGVGPDGHSDLAASDLKAAEVAWPVRQKSSASVQKDA